MMRGNLLIILTVAALAFPSPALPFCFDEAGRAYGISPQLLQGIARVESGMNPAAVNRNNNGSTDFGLMQINSFWLKPLGTTPQELMSDPCRNVMAGARILRECLDRHGETWEAIGCYNATSRDKRVSYSWKVYRELLKGAKTAKRNDADKGVKTASPVSSMQVTVTETN